MKKKLAILIRGQSHNIFYSHKKIKEVNYDKYSEHYNQLIINYSKDYDIDIFLHTYKSEYLDENKFLNFYNPKAFSITTSITSTNIKCQSDIGKNIYWSVRNVIELYFDYCSKNIIEHDLILIMRYDWMPSINLNINILNPTNFNVYGIFIKHNKVYSDDNILLTSFDNIRIYLKLLVNAENKKIGNLHWIVQLLDKNKLYDINNL